MTNKVVEIASFEWERVHGFTNYVSEILGIDWYSWSSVSGLKIWEHGKLKSINPDCITLAAVLEYYLNNEISIVELSKIHNVSYNIVSNLIKNKSYKHIMKDKREEIKNKSNNLYKAKLDKVKELYNNNYSQNQIAKILKISRNTIRKIISN